MQYKSTSKSSQWKIKRKLTAELTLNNCHSTAIQVDLLMGFYCKTRCWTRKELFGFYIRLSWLKFDSTVWDDDAKKWAYYFLLLCFLYFLYIWKYCNDTQLVQIAKKIRIWVKKKKKKFKKKPRARVSLTPIDNRDWLMIGVYRTPLFIVQGHETCSAPSHVDLCFFNIFWLCYVSIC